MPIAFVNATSTFNAAAGASIASSAFDLTAGSHVVVGVRCNTATQTTVTSMTDTAGNTYRLAGLVPIDGSSDTLDVWYCANCLGNAANVVTATLSASAVGRGIAVGQWSGLASISPLDVCVVARKANGVGADITSPAFTTAVAAAVLIAFAEVGATGFPWSPDSGWTEATEDASNVMQIQYQIVNAIQSGVTVTATNASTAAKAMIVISLHADIDGGGGGGGGRSPTLGGAWG